MALPFCQRAEAAVTVNIDRSSQTMEVAVDGMPRYHWRVSTARRGYITPPGTYHPQMMARRWFSRLYYNSPMPHSIFFHGGYAIHGTYAIAQLGAVIAVLPMISHGPLLASPDRKLLTHALHYGGPIVVRICEASEKASAIKSRLPRAGFLPD